MYIYIYIYIRKLAAPFGGPRALLDAACCGAAIRCVYRCLPLLYMIKYIII